MRCGAYGEAILVPNSTRTLGVAGFREAIALLIGSAVESINLRIVLCLHQERLRCLRKTTGQDVPQNDILMLCGLQEEFGPVIHIWGSTHHLAGSALIILFT